MRLVCLVVAVAGCSTAASRPDADAGGGDGAVATHCRGAGAIPAWATPVGEAGLRVGDLELTALDDGMLHLRWGDAPASDRPTAAARLAADGDAVELCAPELAVTVTAAARVTVRDVAGAVIVEDLGVRADGDGLVADLRTPPGERFYGFGERTGRLDKRGRRMTFWNTDAYDAALGGYRPDQDPLYLSIPFFVGLRDGVAWGLLTDDPRRLVVDLAAADPERATIRTPATALAQIVIAGPSIREVVRRHTAVTGRTPLPPRWALGYHQSRWGYAPASRLTDLARTFRERAIGLDALWLDIQHLRGFRTFTWDPATFADPAGLAAALAADGIALIVIADPGIMIDPGWDVYDGGVAGDHFLREADGSVYQGVVWPGPSAFPDFTRAETRAWWGAHVGGLVGLGVRGVWLDVNEPTTFPEGGGGTSVPDELVTSTGATMAEVHNVYAVLEAQATWEGMRAAAPDRRPFVLSRAGSTGIQRWAAVWTGDAVSSWAGLETTLPMLLGLGLSGVPFVGSDVGGYSGGATPELYARWMGLGAVSPFFRGHVTNGVGDQEPWAFGPEVEEISRRLIAERDRRIPYLYALFAEAEASGAPVLRPMVYEFQDDPACWDLDDQAMLGPSILVAPVATPGATSRSVYLPPGRWIEPRSGAAYDGPGTIEVDLTWAALPTLLREGAIVPGVDRVDVVRGDGSFVLHEDDGDGYGPARRVRYRVEAIDAGTVITAEHVGGDHAPPARDLVVRLLRVDHAPTAVRLDGAAVLHTWDDRDLSLTVAFPDRADFRLEIDHDPAPIAAPTVRIPIEVRVPAKTTGDVHVASSATGWTHVALERIDATTARGELEVPRGAWFFYKFTRGSWETVEKQGDCGELANRYRFGAAEAQPDAVARWRDTCE